MSASQPPATLPSMPDAFAVFDNVRSPQATSPWRGRQFAADLGRLEDFVSVCAAGKNQWAGQESGRLGRALDLWAADELRRAGYEPDAVWPRADIPRALPASVARAINGLPKALRAAPATRRIQQTSGSAIATVFGEFFPKEVDVLVADWDRGVELMISTKSMIGSYSNNLKNRWEEFVGDLRNIRGRHPLAVLGVLFMVDRSITDKGEANAWARLLDMLTKLRLPTSSGPAYDGAALVVAEAVLDGKARLHMDLVPAALAPGQMFASLMETAFSRLPETERQAARRLYHAEELPTAEAEPSPQLAPRARGGRGRSAKVRL